MRFNNDLVIDTFKYNVKPNFYLPVGSTATIKCTNWKGTEINDNGVFKESLHMDIVECNGETINAYLQVYDLLCENFAKLIREAILEKRAYVICRITNDNGVYSIERITGDKPVKMPENSRGMNPNE